jgi:hypothetical protein
MRLNDEENPVWPGFHDGETWRTAAAATVSGPVLGWMNLLDAALMLDDVKPPRTTWSTARQGTQFLCRRKAPVTYVDDSFLTDSSIWVTR